MPCKVGRGFGSMADTVLSPTPHPVQNLLDMVPMSAAFCFKNYLLSSQATFHCKAFLLYFHLGLIGSDSPGTACIIAQVL